MAVSCELRCRSKTWLGLGVAVPVTDSYGSDLTPSLGTSICCTSDFKKTHNIFFFEIRKLQEIVFLGSTRSASKIHMEPFYPYPTRAPLASHACSRCVSDGNVSGQRSPGSLQHGAAQAAGKPSRGA